MADLATVERAFMKAHTAGDKRAAGVLAREVKRLRAMPAAPQMSNTADKTNRELSMGETALDAAKSFGTGLAKGAIGIAGLTGDVSNLAIAGLGKLHGQSPEEIVRIQGTNYLPTSGQIQGAIERNVTGPFYEPKSTVGDVSQTVGEFAPNAVGGGTGLVRKGAMVVAPALASEAAGKLTEGTPIEPYARAGAAILTGGGTHALTAPSTAKVLGETSKTLNIMRQAKTAAYKLAEDTAGKQKVDLPEFAGLVRKMNGTAIKAGLGGPLAKTTDMLHPRAKAILSDVTRNLKDMVRGKNPLASYADLENMRETLNKVVKESKDIKGNMNADGQLALSFIKHIDEAVGSTPFKDARKAYTTLRKTQRIEEAITNAEEASSSLDLAYKREFKKIVKENYKNPRYTPAEMAAIRQVAGHGKINNLLEGLGRAGFSSKSVAAGGVMTGLAGFIGPLIGIDPITSMAATSALTTGAKVLGTKMTKGRAGMARDIVALGGENAATDAKIAAAKTARLKNSAAVAETSVQQANDSKRRPVRLKNGSIYWNPSPEEYRRLIASGEASPV